MTASVDQLRAGSVSTDLRSWRWDLGGLGWAATSLKRERLKSSKPEALAATFMMMTMMMMMMILDDTGLEIEEAEIWHLVLKMDSVSSLDCQD